MLLTDDTGWNDFGAYSAGKSRSRDVAYWLCNEHLWSCTMKRLILAFLRGGGRGASSPGYAAVKTIVLVHGAFADGSGWKPVADILQSHGYSVRVVQEPETSFAADVAATRRVLDKLGPCVLVGHSYGGMIITAKGMKPDEQTPFFVWAHPPPVAGGSTYLSGHKPPDGKSHAL